MGNLRLIQIHDWRSFVYWPSTCLVWPYNCDAKYHCSLPLTVRLLVVVVVFLVDNHDTFAFVVGIRINGNVWKKRMSRRCWTMIDLILSGMHVTRDFPSIGIRRSTNNRAGKRMHLPYVFLVISPASGGTNNNENFIFQWFTDGQSQIKRIHIQGYYYDTRWGCLVGAYWICAHFTVSNGWV